MNKLIDLGSHMFEGLNGLLRNGVVDSSYGVYCFEPNPNVYQKALGCLDENCKNFSFLNLYNYAVSNTDEIINFNLDESKTSQSCNILENPPDCDVVYGGPPYTWTQVSVKSISANTLLDTCNIQSDDRVKIKCDVEGAEFVFLWDLLKCDRLSCISEIMVEWHERFWYPNHEPKIHEKNELIQHFIEKNVSIKDWY